MKVSKLHLYLSIVLLFLGFLVGFQYQLTNKRTMTDIAYSWNKEQQIQEKLIRQKEENKKLEEQIREVEDQIHSIEQKAQANQDEATKIHETLDYSRMLAGLMDVEGPGLIVTLNDSKKAKEMSGDVSSYIVHEQDLRRVVNELFASGAEAISVNGERMISTSTIKCVGPTILVNSIKKAPPFEIKAIGDPDTLLKGLELPGGVLDTLRIWEIQITTQKVDKVVIPRYMGTIETNKLSLLHTSQAEE
ncbi:DUF881 domain-containing protein [Tepidibacillus fermentans]|uniref:Uncharacterized protein YlxW (UPF0749 family) n=1 Tax=Tepidibacillus fermentans TaxID=1281767 RepID=A0A4V2UT64_9BACI|nr:DUF881 domain-containing protein [Tepidibacillus fermentans]TCS84409.1 uncharacterized protein YlxW (UPF0749 family) [Tepidibacillus fermentans]